MTGKKKKDGTSRREWGQKILQHLKNKPYEIPTLREKLGVAKGQERTFYRAVSDLKCYGLIEGDAILRIPGSDVEEIKATIGPRTLRLTIPLKKETAKKLLKNRPFIRRAILKRKGIAYELLTDLGLLEKREDVS